MSAPKHIPQWVAVMNDDLLERFKKSDELRTLVRKAQKEYLHWDAFRFQPIPPGFTAEEAWSAVKWTRVALVQPTPVRSKDGEPFQFAPINRLFSTLSYIDVHAAGFIRTLTKARPTEAETNKFVVVGLTEEAIATSQIEGANTSRNVAREMLASQRKPRTKSEQMIVNSYLVMQRMAEWKTSDLSRKMLLEIQTLIVEKTMERPGDQGRFRKNEDEIVVCDPLVGTIVHSPPEESEMNAELDRLIAFANHEEDEDEYLHPVVKASILHFWIAYLHPFVDGNGRTARAVFYWYLLKKNYWLVEYLSISRAIVHSRKKYDAAFVHSETDDNDLTYFVLYVTDCVRASIDSFIEYFAETRKKDRALKETAKELVDHNPRQVAMLHALLSNPEMTVVVRQHQSAHGVSLATANNDLNDLERKGALVKTTRGKKNVFLPNLPLIKKQLGLA